MLVRKINIPKEKIKWEKKSIAGGEAQKFDTHDIQYFFESTYNKKIDLFMLHSLMDALGASEFDCKSGTMFDHPKITWNDETDMKFYADAPNPQEFSRLVNMGIDCTMFCKKPGVVDAYAAYANLHYNMVDIYDTDGDVCVLQFSDRNREPTYTGYLEKMENGYGPVVNFTTTPDAVKFLDGILHVSSTWDVDE